MAVRASLVPLLLVLVSPWSATAPAAAAPPPKAGLAAPTAAGLAAPTAAGLAAPTAAGLAAPTAAGFVPPLSTRGRYIVDATGVRFRLKSGNWHGASGTWNGSGDVNDNANHHAGENSGRVPLGLDRAPIDRMVSSFREIGLNSVRLPFSDEMVVDTQPVADAAVAANPRLKGKTPLQVYDEVVAALTG